MPNLSLKKRKIRFSEITIAQKRQLVAIFRKERKKLTNQKRKEKVMSVWVNEYNEMLEAHEDWSMTLDKPSFYSIDDAIFCLLENLIESKYHNKSDMAKAISYIAKERAIHQYSEFSEEDLEFYSLQDVLNMKKSKREEDDEIKKRMLRHIHDLENQIYGKEEIDAFSVDASLSNLSFHCGHYRTSNSNLNIKRKSCTLQKN